MHNSFSPKNGTANSVKAIRCGIYARKSKKEGLDQEFNSLHAQREAAEAYITSQKEAGWNALPDQCDDGGFSGGNLDRPTLQRLLADVEARRVYCVVYKVDRLSRSLLDFARVIDRFDQRSVSFVSVTQQFNTTSSLGRLTLIPGVTVELIADAASQPITLRTDANGQFRAANRRASDQARNDHEL